MLGKVLGGQKLHCKLQILVISMCIFLNFFIRFPLRLIQKLYQIFEYFYLNETSLHYNCFVIF